MSTPATRHPDNQHPGDRHQAPARGRQGQGWHRANPAKRPGLARSETAVPATVTIPGHWAERALCGQADPDAWFPDKGQRHLAAIAKRICEHCAVRAQCLEYALSGADTWAGTANGIWGGTTPKERAQLRQQRKTVAA